MADVTIAGHKFSRTTVGIVAAGSLIAVYYAWKQHQASSAAASASPASSPSSIDPVTGLPYSQDSTIDPLTGEPYLAEAQQYGSVSAAEAAYAGSSSLDYSGAYGYGSGVAGTATSYPAYGSTTGTAYASNAAWAAAVDAGLTDIGYSSSDISAAVNAYLAGAPLTSTQATIVQDAVSEFGPPPAGAPSITLAPTTNSTSTGSTPASSAASSSGKGGPITVVPVDLHTTQVSATSVGVAWIAPTIPAGQGPLTGYTLQVFNASGSPEGTPWTVPASQLYGNAGGLKSKTAYHVNVWCDPARSGGPHASVSFTTT